jgi:hypothetical protein
MAATLSIFRCDKRRTKMKVLPILLFGAATLAIRCPASTLLSLHKPVTGDGSTLAALTDGLHWDAPGYVYYTASNPSFGPAPGNAWYGPFSGASFVVNLLQPFSIDSITVGSNPTVFHHNKIAQFSIDVSLDGVVFKRIVEHQIDLKATYGMSFNLAVPEIGQYVRFVAEKSYLEVIPPPLSSFPNGFPTGLALDEFEVFGTASAVPEPSATNLALLGLGAVACRCFAKRTTL